MKKGTITILSALAGAVCGAGAIGKVTGKEVDTAKSSSDKYMTLFLMMNQWVKVKQEGKNLVSYFENNGYKKIAVYGMSYAGDALIHELKDTRIEVAYGIDRNAAAIYSEVDIFSADDNLESVDVVVVTAITFFDEIKELLSDKVTCPIVSLENILYEV